MKNRGDWDILTHPGYPEVAQWVTQLTSILASLVLTKISFSATTIKWFPGKGTSTTCGTTVGMMFAHPYTTILILFIQNPSHDGPKPLHFSLLPLITPVLPLSSLPSKHQSSFQSLLEAPSGLYPKKPSLPDQPVITFSFPHYSSKRLLKLYKWNSLPLEKNTSDYSHLQILLCWSRDVPISYMFHCEHFSNYFILFEASALA